MISTFLTIISFLIFIPFFGISECMQGYIGLNCTEKCPYPTFGERCQGYCSCSNDMCDVTTGCKTLVTGTYYYM